MTDAPSTRERSRNTGMALVLLMLLAQLATGRPGLTRAAIAILVVTMTVPLVLRPISLAWYGLSEGLGTVSSKVLLALVFYLLVTPIGVVRRLLGHDSLRLRAFKVGNASVMHERRHVFAPGDLDKPY